jgi:hypothetical protein
MSLGQGQAIRDHLGLLGRFAVAFAVSSFAVFGVAGAVGVAASRALTPAGELAIVAVVLAVALALDAYSLRRKTWCPVTLRRQTPKTVLYDFGPRRAAVAWGLDTGLVFTTYRVSSISWALLALAALGAAPWWTGLGYAAGFLIPLAIGCSLAPMWSGDSATTKASLLLMGRPIVARATSVTGLAITLTAAVIAAASHGL